ncbi:uncharacterized protein LOC103722938 [Phoenix dactylifera]|uniref:Uncharacterized protein LOC103722938 n=1 Tax=Phoenix dactylifera TaxID=42345 RepID=A0A8B7D3A4_PHODC|nr:uncharacterized protein LOC103722938 [Phoenix dactylifera]
MQMMEPLPPSEVDQHSKLPMMEQAPPSFPGEASKLKLKLMVDQHSNHVLFAEAGKDVVDFLFDLLKLPIGSVASLLSKYRIAGSIDKLRDSVESLDDAYFILPAEDRHALLNPQIFSSTLPLTSLLLENEKSSDRPARKYYRCSGTSSRGFCAGQNLCGGEFGYVTDVRGTQCPCCRQEMTVEVKFVAGEAEKARAEAGGGYVKKVVTYMVMDDLSVMPVSTTTAITLLNNLLIKDVSSLNEWTVELGTKEGLDLLKASLRSTTVLTDVFLGKSEKGVPLD